MNSMYVDTYVSSKNVRALELFCAGFPNVIGICRGRAAVPEMILEDGTVCPAVAAVGDEATYYACIRSRAPLELTEAEIALDDSGRAVLGNWA